MWLSKYGIEFYVKWYNGKCKYFIKIESRMPLPIGGGELPVFVIAPVLTFSWQEIYQNR